MQPSQASPTVPPLNKPFRPSLPFQALAGLSPSSQECIKRLQEYVCPPHRECYGLKEAAVLVALFERPGLEGLQVLLTTRSKELRSHPNQTALPGGKVDPTDPSADYTARREAFEEVGLPMGEHPDIHYLTEYQPFLSKYKIIVYPIIYLLTSPLTLLPLLHPSPAEVSAIFDYPLLSCLTGEVGEGLRAGLCERGGGDWPYEEEFRNWSDMPWLEGREGGEVSYRMNRFRTSNTPLKGLTSDILISLSSHAHAFPPSFQPLAPSQPSFGEAIEYVIEQARVYGPPGRAGGRRRSGGDERELKREFEEGVGKGVLDGPPAV